ELENKVTKKTKACFEPALDYVVVKMPRWDLKKFKEVDTHIGSEMKSVGEVMSIGRKFEEALQKALRMIETGMNGLTMNNIEFEDIKEELKYPTESRVFAIGDAIKQGWTIEKIHDLTKIDKWFLYKIKNIVDCENKLLEEPNLSSELLLYAKQLGFSDQQIALILNKDENQIRTIRRQQNILPYVKQIDTLSAEYPAFSNYLYLTYNASTHDIVPSNKSVIVLGSGSYRIGSSVEFDWCCVNALLAIKQKGFNTIMINYNPETVSTDYDICDRLYFDEISFERVVDINEFESPEGVIVSMGGQIPNNIAMDLHTEGVKILGTAPEDIDRAENRHKFSKILDKLGIDQPQWKELTNIKKAKIFANQVGYPVLIRPSYVLSGAAMNVVWSDAGLEKYLNVAISVNPKHPVVITKFIENSKEVEIDAVAQNGEIIIYAITEHVENAGVHSGDATILLPAQRLYVETIRKVKSIAKKIAKELNITGPFNIQFLAYHNKVRVIECNLRASRSFPFCSKIFKKNMIEIATNAIMGDRIEPIEKSAFDLDYVGVKAAQFSFPRLKGADPVLGVEMASTGEVACIGPEIDDAFLKAMISVGQDIPKKNILLSTGPIESKAQFLESARILQKLNYTIYASIGTAKFLKNNNVEAVPLHMPLDKKQPNIMDYLLDKKIELVLNVPKNNFRTELRNGYLIRRTAVDFDIPLITDIKVAIQYVSGLEYYKKHGLEIKSWEEY
ncbi:MAG: carbamoyl-phosphate synthase large subunit, partial [Candidatus Marinimicrobia bacterium]|nr:carbamoyl-phosphate synthase large subunit [Candidatus Neomarinimicrobiota bacterium]